MFDFMTKLFRLISYSFDATTRTLVGFTIDLVIVLASNYNELMRWIFILGACSLNQCTPSPLPPPHFHPLNINNDINIDYIYDVFCISQYIRPIFLGLSRLTDSAVLGGVAEVVSSNLTVGHKIFFSIYRHS